MVFAQKIGKIAPPSDPEVFPANAWGVDIMFCEGGFGFGTFFRYDFNPNFTGFADISFSESANEREIPEFNYYTGEIFVRNKVNRVFLVPVTFGVQQRLFYDALTENLRPYITAGLGPSMVITTPYAKDGQSVEFFKSFGDARSYLSLGGYIGFGANIGGSKSSLVGINIRYYVIRILDKEIETIRNKFEKDFGGIYLSLNIGLLY